MGDRISRKMGKMKVVSKKNNIECVIDFYEGGGWFGSDIHLLDYFEFCYFLSLLIF